MGPAFPAAQAWDDRPTTARPSDEVGSLRRPATGRAAAFRLGTLAFRAPGLIGIGFRKTGEMVALGEDLALHVWPADGKPEGDHHAPHRQETVRMAKGSNRPTPGSPLGFWDNERKLVVWDVSADKPVAYLSREVKNVYGLEFSANGEWLAVNDTMELKDLLLCVTCPRRTGAAFSLGGSDFESLSFTADGKELAVATRTQGCSGDRHGLRRRNCGRGDAPKGTPDVCGPAASRRENACHPAVEVDASVRTRLCGCSPLETGKEMKAFTLSSGPARSARYGLGFSPDGKTVWTGGPDGV